MALKVKTYNNVQANVTFSKASSRVEINPTAGAAATENIALTLGKISKWYDSLVPTGGSSGKILVYNSSGTAKWNDPLHPTITKSADTTSTASPAHGGTFTTVDSVTRDANGHVTKINTKTVTLPSDQNTDTKVNVTLATTTKAYLLGTSTTPTGTAQAVTSLADTGVYLDTTAGRLTTGSLWSNGDITLYTSGTGNSPAIFFRRGTLIDSSLDWKLYDTEGRLHFDRNISGSTESWENILKLDPTNSKMYFKNTEVSLAGHTHNYVPNTQAGMNTAINLLGTGTSDPQLADYYIAQYAGGGTTTTTYHRRPISALWNTFRALISCEVTGDGNAVTSASWSNDGNNRKLTLTKGATFLTSLPSHNHAYTVPPSAFAVQTGSSKQSHITLQTLMTWLITTKAYITSGANRSLTLCTTWSYADNDILQLSIDGVNYELQLAGVIIEFDGSATDYQTGMFRLRIHSSPTTSFTANSGYTKFPVSHIAEYTCNGSSYSPTWKMLIDRADISNGTSTTGNGTISVAGKAVSVYGLGSAAYTASTAYLPSTTKYAASASVAGPANLLAYSHTNEINFSGGKQAICYFNYRDADTNAEDTGETPVSINYKFCDYRNSTAYTTITAANFAGNASTATKWKTARTLTIGSTGKSVDGSGNVSWSLSEIGAAAASHTHDSLEMKTLTSSTVDTTAGTFGFKGTGLLGNTSADWAGFQVDASNDRFQLTANGQLLFRQNDESTMAGNWSAWVGCITPNNVSATSGIKVTKTTSSVGTGDGSLTYYSGVKIEHDVSTSADTTNSGTLSHGGTFTAITSVTRDSYGHVKTLNTKTYTLPGSGDTDVKVTQTAVGSTYTNYRPLVISASNADSAPPTATTVTDGTFITSSIYCQPSSGSVYATKFIGPLQGNADTATTATNANNVYTTVTNGTTTTTRYGVVFAADPNTSENNAMRKTYDFRINLTNGSTSTTGLAELVLGNEKAKNTADNKQGSLTLYSSGTSYHQIYAAETNSAIAHTLPATSGTILNSGTTSFTRSLTSGTKIGTLKINGTSTDLYCQTNSNTTYTLGTSGDNVTLTPSSGSVQSITVPYATSSKEAYLRWGGKDFTGDCSPVDQAMVASLSPNRLELTRASGITIERSTNTGSSWSAVTMTDGEKRMMTSIAGPAMKVTTTDTRGMNANAAKYLLRITLDASSGVIYSLVNKFVTKISTSGSSGCYVKIYRRTVENAASGTDTWQVWNKTSKSWVATTDSSATDANTKNYLDGWFGFNVVNFTEFKIGTTTNAGQYRNVRFVFGAEANNNPADSSHSVDTYGGMSVYNVLMYGGFGWGTPSNLANTGHLYSWDGDEKATFPAEIKVPTQMRIFAASYGMIIRNDNTNTYFLPTAANDPQGSWRSPDSSYQFPLYISNSSGKVTMGNNVEIVGSLILSKTQDAVLGQNKYPALIVGGAPTDAHLELDGNEIMAKSNGTTGASLYLNSENGAGYVFINDGYAGHFTATPTSGQIVVTDGTTGGIKSSGYSTSSFLSSSTKYALSSSVGGAALSVSTQGGDVVLGTPGTSSNDSGDIVWKYGVLDSNNNPIEKARLWTANEYTAKSGPNYRVYKSDGTLLYNGTLPLADGTGASGSWSINASTATRSSYIDIVASNEVRFSVATKPANATDIHIGHAWSDGTSDAKINSYIFKNGGGGLALIKSKGYYLVDSGGNTYTGLYDNGTNLWIGSTQTQAKHHIGQTYISAGYNSTNSTGNSTIYISVPTDANNNGTNYAALHAGNFTTTGSGNAITSVAFTDEKLTFTKGSTFSLSTHTHNYAGSASAGGPATSVATAEANADANRVVFFADNTDTKKLVYDNDFKYNPSTNELTAQKFKGSLLRYHPSADLSKAGSDTTVSVTEYPSYTFSYVQTPAIFGGTDGRMGDSSGNWWAHYAVMSHGSGNSQYRYILRFPFWGAPQYQRPAATSSNERWRNILTDETGAGGSYFLAYPADGYYYSHGGATGAIDITLPVGPGMMLSFSVDIWDYAANKSCTYKIAGYGYASDNKWYGTTAYCIGKPTHSMAIPIASSGGQTEITNLNVRFGYNNTSKKLKVQIGETDTSWSYLAVQIHDVTFCYGTTYFSTISKGWSIGLVTSNIPNVSSTIKATNIAYHASAIALTHGNECNFTGPSSGNTNIWFGYRKADVDGTETNTAYISRYLFGNGNNTAVAGITCGDIIINTATTGTPTLSFIRGTTSDNYYDWRLRDSGGDFYFDVCTGSNTWTSRAWFPYGSNNFTILGSMSLKNGSYTATVQPSTMTANRTLVLPDKSGGLPVSNILYENSTGTQAPVVAEAKGYKYFIVTVYHGALGEQTAMITPNQTITDHCYFSWTRIDDSQAASLRVAGAHIKVEPASSTNSITFTVYISDRHILAPGNSSTISSVATSGTPVIRKIIGFM